MALHSTERQLVGRSSIEDGCKILCIIEVVIDGNFVIARNTMIQPSVWTSIATSPSFSLLAVQKWERKTSHMSDIRVERAAEGDGFWTWKLTVQSNSSSTAIIHNEL